MCLRCGHRYESRSASPTHHSPLLAADLAAVDGRHFARRAVSLNSAALSDDPHLLTAPHCQLLREVTRRPKWHRVVQADVLPTI